MEIVCSLPELSFSGMMGNPSAESKYLDPSLRSG